MWLDRGLVLARPKHFKLEQGFEAAKVAHELPWSGGNHMPDQPGWSTVENSGSLATYPLLVYILIITGNGQMRTVVNERVLCHCRKCTMGCRELGRTYGV